MPSMKSGRETTHTREITVQVIRRKGLKRTPLKQQSKKRQSEQYAYRKAKGELVAAAQGMCQGRIPNICSTYATDMHHIRYRSRGASYVPGEGEARILCRFCHEFIHRNTRWAREQGFLK